MFLAYWPVLGFVVALVLVAVFTVLFLASRVCRMARHEALPERPLQSYLPETVSPIVQDFVLGFGSFLPGFGFAWKIKISFYACLMLSFLSTLHL